MTIVNLAQNYVGSNNINLLEPRGQFGTRLCGGKDSASPRYIFTLMSPLTRLIFHPHDDPLLVVSISVRDTLLVDFNTLFVTEIVVALGRLYQPLKERLQSEVNFTQLFYD